MHSERKKLSQLLQNKLQNKTKILHNALRKAVLKQIRTPCKDIFLRLVTQKIHVHGLVLHDVMDMLENTANEENFNYLVEYFGDCFKVFRKKILHVFDGCPDIRLNDMIREKFNTAVRKIREFTEDELKASKQSSLIQVICQNNYIRSLGVGEKDFDGIVLPKYNNKETSNLVKSYGELPVVGKEKIEKESRKRMDDESEIIKKLKNLISDTDEVNTDITLHQQSEIKEKVISDVNHHLFQCVKTCPFCHCPYNEKHPGDVTPDNQHKSRCHRPQGIAGYKDVNTNKFTKGFCNDLVTSTGIFKNIDTNFEFVLYRCYRTVHYYYNSWEIKGIASDDSLYWKYMTYQVTKNLSQLFPGTEMADVSSWGGISKSEATETIDSLFHLNPNTIAKNKDGFHYIKTSQNHS